VGGLSLAGRDAGVRQRLLPIGRHRRVRQADLRHLVPWWRDPADVEVTDREVELAEILQHIEKYVFSRTLAAAGPDTVLRGNPVRELSSHPAAPRHGGGSRRPRGRRERVGEQSAQLVGGE
jgi:hypothetical protein